MYEYGLEVEDEYATVVLVGKDGSRKEVGWIGGEPEDNTYYRDYAWVVDALNDAYELGFNTARMLDE